VALYDIAGPGTHDSDSPGSAQDPTEEAPEHERIPFGYPSDALRSLSHASLEYPACAPLPVPIGVGMRD